MKIAIVAPTPVPFTVGGAEKLWWGMLEYINKHTKHQCELIKIPTKENDFWSLIDSYYAFYKLDLSGFDLVISGKYPAWMIRHSNHHIYMLHCLRGLYDCYHFTALPENLQETDNEKLAQLFVKLDSDELTTKELFRSLYALKNDTSLDQQLFAFPGAFIRKIIHFFDKDAMKNVKSFSAISKTVASREAYFLKGSSVDVIYPPSTLEKFKNSAYEYFFTVSRLDGAKRIEMIIEAYMDSNVTIPLKIAGTGPLQEKISKRVASDSRIELLGFVSDDELIEYYANAYAVIFTPYDEDYGLITLEAMMSEKPVLTFLDSGGVLEFVEDQLTGLACEPNIQKLTQNIERIAKDPRLCKRMGKEAKKRVQNITWETTVNTLLEKAKSKKKVTVATTYPIYPPRGGGQNRIFYLYKELAKTMQVEVVCLVDASQEYAKKEIAPNLFEIRVPKTALHTQKEQEIESKAGIPITDIAMLYLADETPLYKESIALSFADADYLIATQPYTYAICKAVTSRVIHDSQNVEYILKKQMLKDTQYNQELLQKLFEAEKEACLDALFTVVCADDDAVTMQDLYGLDPKKAVLVPNGVDLLSVPYISVEKRKEIKNSLGLEEQKILLFIGSWHQPNIEAVEEIFAMAEKLPDYSFIIMGSVGLYFASYEDTPVNVGFTGITDDLEKELYLSIADVAINPMFSGSGTNLKMLDYMANGIPVVTTPVGARGLNIPKGYIAECAVEEFVDAIVHIDKYVDIQKSRAYVEENFSWKVIHKKLKHALLELA